MTPHEQTLILKVADEVRTADRTTVDREAEQLIRTEVAAQSHAAYILTQRVIVQSLALQQAQARIAELESRLRQTGAPVGGAGDTAGGSGASPSAPPAGARSGVGDFLKTAAAAAAGTIGGQLIYDGLRHWAAGHGGIGTGFLGGVSGGGFAPAGWGREDFASDTSADTSDRGGGGDWGDNPADEEATDDMDETGDDSDGDDGAGGDWGDDGSGGDGSADGSGGDW